MLGIEDIRTAKRRIDKYINHTPILSSSLLNEWLGHEILFKAENLQKTGAFKARGACNTVSWLVENNQRPERIIANSSGNHSQALAWASSQFGIAATIFMPTYSSKIKMQSTASYGAEIVACEDRNIADAKVKEASAEQGNYWIPPYNHLQIIAGQGTAAYEVFDELDQIDAIFAPCGGGGLLSGTAIAARALSPDTKVIGVEPLNANDAAESLRKNSIQKLKAVPDTVADGAMTMAVGEITFEYLKQLDEMYEISESDILYWTQWLTHLLKLQVEPTSAMSMAGVIHWLSTQKVKKRVVIILSGGNIDATAQSKIWEQNYLDHLPSL